MKRLTTLLCAAQVCLATLASAAPLAIKLPPETAVFKPSELPGYALAQQKCSTCHSADYINFQPPGMTLAQWTAEASKMQHVYGAPISDQDVSMIGAYLAVTYGSAKASDKPWATTCVVPNRLVSTGVATTAPPTPNNPPMEPAAAPNTPSHGHE